MSSAAHVIQRNHLRLSLAPMADGPAVQQRAADALHSQPMLTALDAALSAAGGPDEWLTIERLELDLGHLNSAQLEHQLLDRLPDLLRQHVAEARAATSSGPAAVALHTAADATWAAWLYFLNHGTLPTHWPIPVSLAAWEAQVFALLVNATAAQCAGLRAVLVLPQPAQRLVRQFSVALLVTALSTLDAALRPHQAALTEALMPLLRPKKGTSGAWSEMLLLELVRHAGAGQSPDWPALLAALGARPTAASARPSSNTQLAQAALLVVQDSVPRAAAPAAGSAPEPALAATPEFVPNAGVVLLHPFLATCFAACGWLVGDDFRNETARAKAVLLVHFLATGATQAPEYELRLAKLLCGMPATTALHQRRLSRAARAEGVTLLTAAINYWAALKNTSPDGLREAFLQREGKLELAPDGQQHILTVEQRAQDVLLGRLPYGWGLGLIQLPWMPGRLTINWA